MLLLILLITVVGGFMLLNLHIYWIRRKYRHFNSPPISPGITWFLGLSPEFKKFFAENPHPFNGEVFSQYHHKFGWNLYVMPIFHVNIIFCMELDILAKFVSDWKKFPKDEEYHRIFCSVDGVRMFGKYGLLSDPGTDVWHAKRKALDPGFHKSFMKAIIPGMNRIVHNLVRNLASKAGGDAFDISVDLNRCAFEAISVCGFSWTSEDLNDFGNSITDVIPYMLSTMSTYFKDSSFSYPWSYREMKKKLHEKVPPMRESVKKLLLKRIKENDDMEDDILSFIIRSNQCSEQLTIDDLVDDYVVFLTAGMETTAITMAMSLFYLSNNPKMFAMVRSEIDSLVQRRQPMKFEDVNKLSYLEMVVKECLRIKPPVCGVGRCCPHGDVVLNGLKIPKDAILYVPIFTIHTSEQYWENPNVFEPKRFSPEHRHKIQQFSYLPFMAGPRGCIGKYFAMMEAKMVLSRIIQEFDIENPDPSITELKCTGIVTARPINGVHLKLHRRMD